MGVTHLAKRFITSLHPGGPNLDDAAWVATTLTPAELDLWRRMSNPDQRHAVGVARRLGDQPTHVLAAALLHDVGKVESGLGTLQRVLATMLRRWRPARYAAYYDHPRIGAAWLDQAGSHELVVNWAREHHLPPERWTVPRPVADALKAADDD